MADTLYNETEKVEITPHIAKTVRTPSLAQVVNTALNGLAHIQNIGIITYQTEVEFVIHQDNDSLLLSAWRKGNLIKVVDGSVTRYGYIIRLELGEDYAEGYHTGTILLQEEVTA